MQFPCIKAFVNDEPLPQLVDLIRANVRTPDMSIGDFYAQAASLRLAGKRIGETCDKYGSEAVKEAMAWLLEDGEKRARAALAKLPKGTFIAEDVIDDDGISDEPIPVKVSVTITDDEFIVDFSEMPPQVAGPINSSRTGYQLGAALCLDRHRQPPGAGQRRDLRSAQAGGSRRHHHHRPATGPHLDLLGDAAVLARPDLEGAGPGGAGTAVGRTLQHRRRFDHHHPPRRQRRLQDSGRAQHGGLGACSDRDGESGLFCSMNGETFNLPVEVTEQAYGLRVDEYAFNPEPGGEGTFRGGRGVVRSYEILSDRGGAVTITLGRHKNPCWGVDGGHDGSRNYTQVVTADGNAGEPTGKTARLPLAKGDVLRIVCGAGGGWGDPAERPREKVLADLRAGLISPQAAREVYGVET